MYITPDVIIKASGVLGACLAIAAIVWKIIQWFMQQEEQTKEINKLKAQQSKDIKEIKEEMCLLTYAVLACLKGLKEQGCDGPVSEAIDKVEKHINEAAHAPKSD